MLRYEQAARYGLAAGAMLGLAMIASAEPARVAVRARLEPARDKVLESRIPSVAIPELRAPLALDGRLAPGEWLEAGALPDFGVPGTAGEIAVPRTRAWLALDKDNLYLAARCGLTPGVEPLTVATNLDGEVWGDDSIEFFVWPAAEASARYYQFAINSAGIRADIRYTIDPATGEKQKSDATWNAAWQARTSREGDAWVLEAAIPLAEVGMKPEPQLLRLNVCRNMRPGSPSYGSWSPLSAASFHLLPDFGLGVCAFGTEPGRPGQLAGAKLPNLLGVLRSPADTRVALRPDPAETVWRLALPDAFLADNPTMLQPALSPLLADGTAGAPLALAGLPLTNSQSVRLLLEGLAPGDYQLAMTVTAAGVIVSNTTADMTLLVREPPREPTVTGKVVFEERDWRGPDRVTAEDGIERNLTAELLLKTEFKTPVLVCDPTPDETITCLAAFQDKLVIGACTKPAVTDTGSIFTYDPDLHTWGKSFQVNEQGITRLEVYGDTLYVPGYDANDGGWSLGNIYLHDGTTWTERRTVPRAVHTYSIARYRDRIYLSADILDPPPEGMTFDEALAKNKMDIYGRVVSSGDGGQTWREEHRGPVQAQDVGYMTVFKDRLVLNARGDLVLFDGKTWKALDLSPNVLFVFDYLADGDTLLMGTPFGLCFYDGEKFWRSSRFQQGQVRALETFGAHTVLAGYALRGGSIGHGPGGANYPELENLKEPAFRSILCAVPPDILYEREAGEQGNEWWKSVQWIRSPEMLVSARTCRGRLYLGTHPRGRLLALPVTAKGSFESRPQRLEASGTHALWWKASTPPGTSVRFQIRQATTADQLGAAAFAGPDGTKDSWFEEPGARFQAPAAGFVQYRAVLATENPALTPYLKQVTVTRPE